MRFPPHFLDDLRSRLPVSEVVGRRVRLKKAGREWKGLSPFNKERTPSFYVNDQKGFFHDFSSGKHGDIFGFVMETEGVTFPEAVERLAGMAGLAMPAMSAEDSVQERRRTTLHEVMDLAAKFFETTLSSRSGAKARGYLADRGINPSVALRFRLGYAPADRFALKEYLGAQGVTVDDMVAAGLEIAGDDIPVPYDRFRDRVMFPIGDLRGRTIAFGGRALDPGAPAKYLNSPETPLFHKGATLYNGQAARQAAHDGATVIAVEGYVDVIAMVTAGFPATVAPLGTALTEDQLGLIWRMTDEPVLLFDGDGAGRKAAYRALDIALPLLKPGKSLLIATLPDGQDPDDLVRSSGPNAVADVVASARPLAEMLWAREIESGTFDTPERRAGLEARLNALTAVIGDESVRRYYRQDLSDRLRTLLRPQGGYAARGPRNADGRGAPAWPRRDRRAGPAGSSARNGASDPVQAVSPRLTTSPIVRGARSALPPREALILLAVLNHPWLIEEHSVEFADTDFGNPDAGQVQRALLEVGARHDGGDEAVEAAALRTALEKRGLAGALHRIDAGVTHLADWPAHAGAAREDVGAWWTHVVTLHRKSRTLNKELRDAERALGDDPTERNFAWLRDVQARLAVLDGAEAAIEGFGALSGRPARGV